MVTEPKNAKFIAKTKDWNIQRLFLNKMVGTGFPSIFSNGNCASTTTIATDTHRIGSSNREICLYELSYIFLAVWQKAKKQRTLSLIEKYDSCEEHDERSALYRKYAFLSQQ